MSQEILTREQVLAARRKTVDTSLGAPVVVRALSYAALLEMSGTLMDLQSLIPQINLLRTEGPTPANLERIRPLLETFEKVIVAAVVSPKFGTDAAAGDLVPSDLPPEDQLAIFNGVLELSGYSKKAAAEVRP